LISVDNDKNTPTSSYQNIKFRYFLIWIAIGFVLLYFVSKIVFIKWLGFNEFSFKYMVSTLTYFTVLFLCFRVTSKNSIPFKNLFTLKDKKFNWFELIGLTLLNYVLSFSLVASVYLYYVYFQPHSLNNYVSSSNPILPIGDQWLVAIQAILIAPFIEELLFRGMIMQTWAIRWGRKRGIFFSSLLFAIIHFSPRIIELFVAGIILSILFIEYRSLIVPILFHAINNILAQFNGFLVRGKSSSATIITMDQALFAGWLGLFLFMISLTIFIIYLKKSQLKGRLPVQ
jgi:uncharacterized protein